MQECLSGPPVVGCRQGLYYLYLEVPYLHGLTIRLRNLVLTDTDNDEMPLNVPGILVPFHLLINPRLVLPALMVKGEFSRHLTKKNNHTKQLFVQEDIRQIDFSALRRAGYRGAVFDKDNCLVCTLASHSTPLLKLSKTLPHKDTLVPELQVR